jgi:outer membrane protein TolC
VKIDMKVIQFLIVTAICSYTAAGQVKEDAFTLKDCIEYAKNENPNLKSAILQEEIAGKKINEVMGSGLPQVSISGSYQDNIKKQVVAIPGGGLLGGDPGDILTFSMSTKHNLGLTGKISQTIFDGSFWVGLSAAKSSGEYYRQGVKTAEEEVVYNVANAYYNVIIASKQIDLLQYNIRSVEETMKNTELLYKNGRVKKVDLDRIKVNHNALLTQLNSAQNGLTTAYENLKYRMGIPFSSRFTVAENSPGYADSAFGADAAKSLLQDTTLEYYNNRIEYKQLLTARELQELNKKNEIAGYIPALSAYYTYSYQSMSEKFNFFKNESRWFGASSVGLNLSWNLFTGGSRAAKIQQADLNIKVMDQNIKDTELAMSLQVSGARTKFKSAYDNIENERNNIELAREVFRVTELEFREGTSTSADLVDAETSLREAQTNYINSLLDLYIARLDYERAKGSLNEYITTITAQQN